MTKPPEPAGPHSSTAGINRLMQDLGAALAGDQNVIMLGGGNPAHIPQVQKYFRKSAADLLARPGEFERCIGNYDPPQGNIEFITALCHLLNDRFNWSLSPQNIALTNGSQAAFFILFNLFAGLLTHTPKKKILFPLIPEYIGYCDVGLADDLFLANRPRIDHTAPRTFKYRIDFESLRITDDIGAICVSRPTNPTGNVLTDLEIEKLTNLAAARNIPLIIDSAYGSPFPDIIFTDAQPVFNDQIILCMSLSKLGLPAARTGIVIAAPEIIEELAGINAITSLAPPGLGPAIALDLIRTGRIIEISENIIKPFYRRKSHLAMQLLLDKFKDVDFHVHKPEGAFFLWLWFPRLAITCDRLYNRLKQRSVLVVPGSYFFPGLKDNWDHTTQCIRINCAQPEQTLATGLQIIAEEVEKASR